MATATQDGLTISGETTTGGATTVSGVQMLTGGVTCVSQATTIAPMTQAGGALPTGATRLGLVTTSRAGTIQKGGFPIQLSSGQHNSLAINHL